MIFSYDFAAETKRLVAKAYIPGVWYKFYPAAEASAMEGRVYYADVRYAMKRCEVVAVEQHIVPGLTRYWAMGRDVDMRSLAMIVIVGEYPLIEIEKLTVT